MKVMSVTEEWGDELQTAVRHLYGKRNLQRKELPKDWDQIQKCLGWRSLDRCKKTMSATTQYANNYLRLALRQHYKSREPLLNCRRLAEIMCTDTFFATVKALGGDVCAQMYAGKKSYLTEALGMQEESSFVGTLLDFIRKWGAPMALLSDNAKSETGKAAKEVLRTYNIKDLQTEPHHPNQNPAERRIGQVKSMCVDIMDRVGAPACLWLLCLQYCCYVLNRMAHPGLKNRTPIEVATGVTPDISNLLQFYFYQPVLYYEKHSPESSFLGSKERLGRWVGVAEHCGDALTYKVLTTDNIVIHRSVMRPADHPLHPNMRMADGEVGSTKSENYSEDKEKPTILQSESDHIDITKLRLPTFEPEKYIGYQFVYEDQEGQKIRAKVKEIMPENRYLIELGDGMKEDVITYNGLMDYVERNMNPDGEQTWMFEKILDHRKKKGQIELLILWSTKEETWEPLKNMAADDPMTVVAYAKDKGFLDKPGWKRFRRFAKNQKVFIRMLRQVNAARHKNVAKYKFGVRVPKSYAEALEIDRINGDRGWHEATMKELNQIEDYETFKVWHGAQPPKGYVKIRCHLVFDVKYDGRKKARLVAAGNLTPEADDTHYAGIASLITVRICLFLAMLNELEICATDIGNAYLEALTKK